MKQSNGAAMKAGRRRRHGGGVGAEIGWRSRVDRARVTEPVWRSQDSAAKAIEWQKRIRKSAVWQRPGRWSQRSEVM